MKSKVFLTFAIVLIVVNSLKADDSPPESLEDPIDDEEPVPVPEYNELEVEYSPETKPVYKEVCDENDTTYPSVEDFYKASDKDKTLRLKCDGKCGHNCKPFACRCALLDLPMCVSDGHNSWTVANPCLASCSKSSSYIHIIHSAECRAGGCLTESNCGIKWDRDTEEKLMCSNEGITFYSKEMFECYKKNTNPTATIVALTSCDELIDPTAQCKCTYDGPSVCSKAGKTYPNDCWLECVKTIFKDVEKKHNSSCEDGPCDTGCVCTKDLRPVCATSGNEYPNICMLDCDKDKLKCGKPCSECRTETCKCLDNDDRVCGSDDITYGNACWAGCQGNGITVKHDGPCNPNEPCRCTKEYAPVCASNRKTYPNRCLMDCVAKELSVPLKKVCDCSCDKCPQKAFCKCKAGGREVCGQDGRTYDNICEISCWALTFEHLLADYCGRCTEAGKPEERICLALYKPVCGTDGKTYGNDCILRDNMQKNCDLEYAHEGECKEDPCICTREYAPVCGSDGITYPNTCEFKCANKKKGNSMKIICKKPCDQCKQVYCRCAYVGRKVCATNGKTLPNMCHLNCLQKTYRHLLLDYCGPCTKAGKPPIALCPEIYEPVCGSDGKTYSNLCFLNEAKKEDCILELKYNGECAKPLQCSCPKNLAPVCGSDHRTYGNECLFNCENEKRKYNKQKKIYIICKTECKLCHERVHCKCKKGEREVCGTDGITHKNLCSLQCLQLIFRHLGIERCGPCGETSKDKPRICPAIYAPVCGSDGKTYPNSCLLLNAVTEKKKCDLIEKYKGPCKKHHHKKHHKKPHHKKHHKKSKCDSHHTSRHSHHSVSHHHSRSSRRSNSSYHSRSSRHSHVRESEHSRSKSKCHNKGKHHHHHHYSDKSSTSSSSSSSSSSPSSSSSSSSSSSKKEKKKKHCS